jgi:hypothetical protein
VAPSAFNRTGAVLSLTDGNRHQAIAINSASIPMYNVTITDFAILSNGTDFTITITSGATIYTVRTSGNLSEYYYNLRFSTSFNPFEIIFLVPQFLSRCLLCRALHHSLFVKLNFMGIQTHSISLGCPHPRTTHSKLGENQGLLWEIIPLQNLNEL